MFFRQNMMRPGLLVFPLLLPVLVQATVPVSWFGQSGPDVGRVSEQAGVKYADPDIAWERMEAGLVGGIVGGAVGLVVGVTAGALSGPSQDVLNGHRANYPVAGVTIGAVVGAVTAFVFPGTGYELGWAQGLRVPAVAMRSEPGQEEKPVLVLDLCLVSAGF